VNTLVEPVTAHDARVSTPHLPFRPRLLYAIAPPNQATPLARRRAIAAAQSARIASLPIDALLVYDVQDEATRNGNPRPFPFMPKVDALTYALEELETGALPRIVYRAVAEQGERSLCQWLDKLNARGGFAVLVGAPSRQMVASLTLPRALSVCRQHAPAFPVGGVVIPERHQLSGTEDARVWSKMQQGCRFFVSQTVWSVEATKRLLRDLHARANAEGQAVPPIILTFSPCGSAQTLAFLQWLGVDIPRPLKIDLLSAKDMLARSVDLATELYAEMRAFAREHGLTVGCNVESVSSRAEEVDASVELVHRMHELDAPTPARPRSLDDDGRPRLFVGRHDARREVEQ
jgi:hypothetical protein